MFRWPHSHRWAMLIIGLAAASCLKRPVSYVSEMPQIETKDSVVDKAKIRENVDAIMAANYDCSQGTSGAKKQLRLLTQAEYKNSLRDLFRIEDAFNASIPQEQNILGFRNNADVALVSPDHAVAYHNLAKEIAEELVSKRWSQLVMCPVSAGESCATSFVRDYGPLTWRRPLTEGEQQKLMGLYRAGAATSPDEGMKWMIRGLVASPYFLYRTELGTEGKLDAYEVASALSFFFWGSTPDSELFKLAQDKSLLQDNVLTQQAQRLLKDPRAKVGLSAFADAWLNYSAVLNVNKDKDKFPQFDSNFRQTLAAETQDFFDYVVRGKKAGFAELLQADYTVGGQALADFYKAPTTMEGGVQKINLAGTPRRGLLGHASILASLAYATEPGPIQRGVFVREHLMCEMLEPPPPGLVITPPAPRAGTTTRERFAEHTSAPACYSCHQRIDGIGFGMEEFDAIGQYRSSDNDKPVDNSGSLVDLDAWTVSFKGSAELGQKLATSQRAQTCFVIQSYRMAHGHLEAKEDICSIRRLSSRFVDKNLSLAELLLSVITDPSYTNRR